VSVKPTNTPPRDPALSATWKELFAAIKKARKTFEAAGADMQVDIRITERKR